MKTVLDIGVLLVTLLMMVAVGLELEWRDFREVTHRTGTLVGTLLLPVVLLPALGFAIARVLALPSHVRAGILLLAACPVGDIANLYTLLARGNLVLSVAANTLSCLLSVATMPVVFALYDRLLGEHFAVPAPALILRLTAMIAVPVASGMAVRRWKPTWAVRYRTTVHNLCLAGIAFLVVYVLVNRWAQVAAEWRQTALAGVSFVGAALAVGLAVARLLRLDANDRIAVGIAFAVRHVALTTAIAVTLLNRIELAVFSVVYFLAEVPVLLSVAAMHRRRYAGTPPLQSCR
jgi:BASS family bile acid:Na+ symporter